VLSLKAFFIIAQALAKLTSQLQDIGTMQKVFGESSAERYLFQYFGKQAISVVGQSLRLLERIENESFTRRLVTEINSAHSGALKTEIDIHKK
jgi:hypothetical protein